MTKFEALTGAQREAVCAAVANALDDAAYAPCSLYGLFGDEVSDCDTQYVRHDPDRVKEIAAAATNAIADATINIVPPSKDDYIRSKGFAPVGILYGRERERCAIDDHGRATWFSTNESGAYCALGKPELAEPLPAGTTDVGRRVVMAAVRYPTGHVIVGARHFDAIMHKQIDALEEAGNNLFRFSRGDVKQGFVDQRGVFMDRVEAMAVARAAGQILRLCGSDDWLCSEHLY